VIDFPDIIREDLNNVNSVAKELQMKLYVVGGFPRDLVFGIGINEDTDLDLTEAYGNAFDLSFFVAAKYNLADPKIYNSTGTALLIANSGRQMEFHNSFFNVPHIIDQLFSMKIKPTPLNKDVYSRDYTINTLLFDPITEEIHDITKMGIHDIENRILRTPLPPSKTLSLNPLNILRGIRFTVQFGLTPAPEYEKEVVNHIQPLIDFLIKNPTSKSAQNTVTKTFLANPQKAIEEYKKIGILEYLPSNEYMRKAMEEDVLGITVHSSIKKAQFGEVVTMMDRLKMEREKHRAYMRRKKREKSKRRQEKFKIMDKANKGYYSSEESKIDTPEISRKRKNKSRSWFDYIRQNTSASKTAQLLEEENYRTELSLGAEALILACAERMGKSIEEVTLLYEWVNRYDENDILITEKNLDSINQDLITFPLPDPIQNQRATEGIGDAQFNLQKTREEMEIFKTVLLEVQDQFENQQQGVF